MLTALRVTWVAILAIALVGDLSPAAAQGCPTGGGTPYFTIVYGPVQLDGADAPAGAIVEAVSPRGEVTGCFEVTTAGHYGTMYVYGEDTSVTPALPGMRAGEEIAFRVNGTAATASPTLDWANDRDLHELDLAATSAPMPVTDLSGAALGSHLELSWSAVTQNTAGQPITGVTYRVYRGENDPYFVPGGAPHGTTASTTFIDANALGDPASNYTYLVTAVSAAGSESAPSSRIGEFDFSLTGPGYNAVALSLEVAGITDAQSLAEYVCDPLCVDQIWGWDAAAQAWLFRLPQAGVGDNFATQTGGTYFLHFAGAAPAALTLIGEAPDQESVTFALTAGSSGGCSYNFVSLPLDKAEITNVDEMAADMGNTVDQAWQWDGASQDWLFRLPKGNLGSLFSTQIGYPYSVCVDESAPGLWPVY